MEVIADYKQVVGEVKERNRFYNALIKINAIAHSTDDSKLENENGIKEIKDICNQALSRSYKPGAQRIGVSGPFELKDEPNPIAYGGTFSAFETWESNNPEDHFDLIDEILDGWRDHHFSNDE